MNPRTRLFTLLGWAVWQIAKKEAKKQFKPKPSKLKRLGIGVVAVGAVAGTVVAVKSATSGDD
jgi:heme A synthase